MTSKKIACIILAAGKGKRMASHLPKPLHKIAGRAMLHHVIAAAESLNPEKIVVVTAPDLPEVGEAAKPHAVALQREINGTGGAVLAAKEELKGFDGDILVLYSDSPLVTPETLRRMVDIRRQFPAVGLAFAGARVENPAAYGRMITDEDQTLKKIVEFKDASAAEKKVNLVFAGFLCADGTKLFDWLEQLDNDNAAGEYYLTGLPEIARLDNRLAHAVEIPADEMQGANNRAELSKLEAIIQRRLRDLHMQNGATLVAPDTVFFSADTVVGQDVVIEPNVIFGPGVTIGSNVNILAFSHIAGAAIEDGAHIGPFARLRPGSIIGADARIGNFVEIKNARLGKGVKAGHLSYLGDADIGENVNIGAGTITCNYDGFNKHKTVVGRGAFIGSNTALVAPVSVGDGAYVGAGSAITSDVPANALGLTRPAQENKAGWADRFRTVMGKKK